MTRVPRRPGEPLLPELDGEPGPMPPLSAAESEAMAWAAVSRWAVRPPGLDPVDDVAGPAKPLARTLAEQLAQQVVRSRRRQRVVQRLQPWAMRAAAVALCLCGALGVAFAAYRIWPEARASTHGPRTLAPLIVPTRAAQGGTVALTPPVAPSMEPMSRGEPTPPLERDATRSGAAPEAQPAPEVLLARANGLRAQRRWAAAERAYRQVASASVSKEQRYVALVASAALALQHVNQPERALSAYRTALALVPAGNLDEEILYGIAECHRALGDATAELAAIERLAIEHPHGMFIEASKRRQAALEAAAAH